MTNGSLRPIKDDAFDYWKAQHLLNRAGFGGTPAQVRALARMGIAGAVDHLVDYGDIEWPSVDADEFDRDIMRPATEAESQMLRQARSNGDEAAVERFRRERQRRQQADRRQIREVRAWWLQRLIETPRPLEEKMTLFWHGHFATGYRAIEDSYHMFLQNQFFRRHAVGSFADLVYGIIRDPAMLRYLNNNQNNRRSPNENLARELMELFVLGEGNDYTEDDIKEGARALTGYTYRDDEFRFVEGNHDDGRKRILGRVGNWDGTDFCRIILERPVCSQFICLKLYRFFVNDATGELDQTQQDVVLRLAREFRKSNYDVAHVLKTIFKSEHFYDPSNAFASIKSPTQLIVQAVRSLRTPSRELDALASAADLMGQSLLEPPNVKGWPGGRSWINTSTMFVRQNLMVYLLTGKRPEAYDWQTDGRAYDASHMVDHLRSADGQIDVEEAVTYLLRFNLGGEPHRDRVRTIVEHVQRRGGRFDNATIIDVLALITAMPEYQLC